MGDGVGVRRGAAGAPRLRGDEGTGLFPLMASMLIVLIMLGFAVHVLVNLYARSVVAGAAYDAASHMARHDGGDPAGARRTVQQLLGNDAIVRPDVEADYVSVTVTIDAPKFFAQSWMPGEPTISRSARVRIERERS